MQVTVDDKTTEATHVVNALVDSSSEAIADLQNLLEDDITRRAYAMYINECVL